MMNLHSFQKAAAATTLVLLTTMSSAEAGAGIWPVHPYKHAFPSVCSVSADEDGPCHNSNYPTTAESILGLMGFMLPFIITRRARLRVKAMKALSGHCTQLKSHRRTGLVSMRENEHPEPPVTIKGGAIVLKFERPKQRPNNHDEQPRF